MTTRSAPAQEWWTTDALAASGLPDVPTTRQGVDALAARNDWRADPALARRRQGRGGGWEYHWKALPVRAQAVLLKAAQAPEAEAPGRMDRGTAWAWFDGLPEAVKTKARDRLHLVRKVEELSTPMGRHLAVVTVAKEAAVAERTLWGWLAMIEGVDASDMLAYLAPRHRAAAPAREKCGASPEFLDRLKADYLRLAGPSFASAYDRVADLCRAKGWGIMTSRTARRWLDANVPRVSQIYAREGEKGLARCFPPQIRDRSTLTAMEGVNADCHKIDVFVRWPGIEKPVRPQIVGFQDLYSNKILAWRVDLDPNKVAVMSAFGDLVGDFGIPRHCLFDNGREFANKWLTGGTATRFRFKVREDDPLGVLPMLGIQVHWATPAHGQAKPIERGFRDFADRIARHPAFEGAYVGNRPDAKPENYGNRAIPLEEFLAVLDQGIRDHNARPGRLGPITKGRSFDETFAESYAAAPIRKATDAQRRLWLMGQEVRKLDRNHGALKLHENSYWADWMNELAGQRVVARFDPEDLHAGLNIYSLQGEFLGFAECRERTGFFDLVGAKLHARQKAQVRRIEKKKLAAMRPLTAADLAAELAALPVPESPLVEAKVVQLVPDRVRATLIDRPVPQAEVTPEQQARHEAFLLEFRRAEEAVPEDRPDEAPADRWHRALEIEARSEAGQRIGVAEAEWLDIYRTTPEYIRFRMFAEDFGAGAAG